MKQTPQPLYIFVLFAFLALAASSCGRGSTTVNYGRKTLCNGELFFEETFNGKDLLTKWRHAVRYPDYPDYEFNMYDRVPANLNVVNGTLYLKPTLLSDIKGEEFLYNGEYDLNRYPPKASKCTKRPDSGLCSKKASGYNILPPIVTPRIMSTTTFRYGAVEVVAKLPKGDWLFPEIELSPPLGGSRYGQQSGRIIIAMARGNQDLKVPGVDERLNFGTRWLEAGVYAGTYNPKTAAHMVAMFNETPWSDAFHSYRVEWEPGTIRFFVDNEPVGKGAIQTAGLLGKPLSDEAPFDEELVLSLGLGVGGIQRFPDGVLSDGHIKPWKNLSPKAMLSFWRAKETWLPTWNGDDAALKIDSVKVWSRKF